MTSPDTSAPLLTDADVLARVTALIGPASQDRTLWLLFVDGDHRQAPLVVPVDGVPRVPDDDLTAGVGALVAETLEPLATDTGPGSVVLVLERLEFAAPSLDDDAWAGALLGCCARLDLRHRGVFVSAPGGVRRVR